jgi:hypothetical protein
MHKAMMHKTLRGRLRGRLGAFGLVLLGIVANNLTVAAQPWWEYADGPPYYAPDADDDEYDFDQYNYDPYDYDYIYDDDSLVEDGFGDLTGDDEWYFDDFVSFQDVDEDGQRDYSNTRTRNDLGRSSISGEILSSNVVSSAGVPSLVVTIQRQAGGPIQADLGPMRQLRQLNLRDGDVVWVRGPLIRQGNRHLLVATWLKSKGVSRVVKRNSRDFPGVNQRLDTATPITSARPGRQDAEIINGNQSNWATTNQSRDLRPATRQISGTIAQVGTASVRGSRHRITELQTEEGERIVVDLGPAAVLRDRNVSVSRGDWISATGIPVLSNGQRVLIAMEASIDDRLVPLENRLPVRTVR